ncbi:unnamed protein product [Victoria cruziana]
MRVSKETLQANGKEVKRRRGERGKYKKRCILAQESDADLIKLAEKGWAGYFCRFMRITRKRITAAGDRRTHRHGPVEPAVKALRFNSDHGTE